MDYIENTFNRMNLHQLRNFLLYGAEHLEEEMPPYKERLKMGRQSIYARLETLYPDLGQRDEAMDDVNEALTVYESVYMELGMKAGARLIYELLLTDDAPTKAQAADV